MPVYGNWCGPDYPPEGTHPPPIDVFDAACMRHDYCTASATVEEVCDVKFGAELRYLAGRYGGLPRPLRWAEYVIRVKAGGPWSGVLIPTPGDALGLLGSLAAPCW